VEKYSFHFIYDLFVFYIPSEIYFSVYLAVELTGKCFEYIFIFGQVTRQNTEHLPCRVQLVEAIFNEYANKRSGIGCHASDKTLPKLRDWQNI
jgi:hypothetical protein